MGQAKSEWMRDWNSPDTYVCAKCVEDEFLKEVIRNNACQHQCNYCESNSPALSAAPVSALMEHVSKTVFYYFSNPTNGNVPYDEGCIVDPICTYDVLNGLSLDCHEQLFDDIANAFTNNVWVRAADGNWAASHPHEAMNESWNYFVNFVKHNVRFFFQNPTTSNETRWQDYEPQQMLPIIGKLVKRFKLLKKLPAETDLFRVRERHEDADWELNEKQMREL